MALQPNELKGLANTLSMLLDALVRGMTVEMLREGLRKNGVPADAAETWLEMARAFHDEPGFTAPQRLVKNPRYRKGTSRKVVSWADCLWQPPT